mmetsp:Transcript_152235/g.291621  ORF Transcript_152235/g.291621 Transcript_152235/m.291621 type:complete len:606 (+) Transcript_152235:68-1885(+)
MFKWLNKDTERQKDSKTFANVVEGLTKLYQHQLLPIETDYIFHQFYSQELTHADFSSRPMVLMLGQYSTGKTTFIQHLLGRDYPGMRIGPEPTTDNFVVVSHGEVDQNVPGDALVADPRLPFKQCFFFGKKFLTRFSGAQCNCPVLEGITLIDTPGVLTGERQRLDRGYDFEAAVRWFADRVDIILLLFDVFKLDISGELHRAIWSLRGNDHKIHIVLNKADRVTTPQLLRAHGALMWSLRAVISKPEVPRVYLGSFWDEPILNDEQRALFESEENDLYVLLAQLPRGASVRKLNDLIKRARLTKVHVYILDTLARRMPAMFGKEKEKQRMIQNLTSIYQEICHEKDMTMGDFPEPRMMQEKLQQYDFSKFKKLDSTVIDVLDSLVRKDLPALLELVNAEAKQDADVKQISAEESPFAVGKVEGANQASAYASQWPVSPDKEANLQDVEDTNAKELALSTDEEANMQLAENANVTETEEPSNPFGEEASDGQRNPFEGDSPCVEESCNGQENNPFGAESPGVEDGPSGQPNNPFGEECACVEENSFGDGSPFAGETLVGSKLGLIEQKIRSCLGLDSDDSVNSSEYRLAVHFIKTKLEGHVLLTC